MPRQWYVIDDRQGGDFGMYRLYTAEEWLDQAAEWLDHDDMFGYFDDPEDSPWYSEENFREIWGRQIKKDPQKLIDFIDDYWEITLVEQGVDGNDFYTDFPEEDTPYGYYN